MLFRSVSQSRYTIYVFRYMGLPFIHLLSVNCSLVEYGIASLAPVFTLRGDDLANGMLVVFPASVKYISKLTVSPFTLFGTNDILSLSLEAIGVSPIACIISPGTITVTSYWYILCSVAPILYMLDFLQFQIDRLAHSCSHVHALYPSPPTTPLYL